MSEQADLDELQQQVAYLQQALAAVGGGGVDALVVGAPDEEQIYTLSGADRPYRVIVENMGEAAVTVSEHGLVLYANPRFAEFLGVRASSMAGRDFSDFVSVQQLPALATLLGARTDETRRAELSIPGADGTPVPFLVAATDLEIGDVLVRCLVLTDLTMQKLVEKQVAGEAARTERQQVAHEVNDTIVQGLVAAEMALDLGQVEFARSLVARTSAHARHWIGELAGTDQLEPGMAVRSGPARGGTETP